MKLLLVNEEAILCSLYLCVCLGARQEAAAQDPSSPLGWAKSVTFRNPSCTGDADKEYKVAEDGLTQ